jgi:hypothetical protein
MNISAVIHNDSVINEEDIKSFSENEEVITSELILKDIILFSVSNIITMIDICQYIFFVVYVRRSTLDSTIIFSSIFLLIGILLYLIHMFVIL